MMDVNQTDVDDPSLDNLIQEVKNPDLAVMLKELALAPAIYQPSRFWKQYLRLNIQQLQDSGLDNFKTTVNQNYFNWVGGDLKEQKAAMIHTLGRLAYVQACLRAWTTRDKKFKPPLWTGRNWRKYVIFLHLFWSYTLRKDVLGWVRHLHEPLEGHPLTVLRDGKYISQDICNSILELNAVFESGPQSGKPIHCVELGAGYGRVGYCLLNRHPAAKYAIIDIPPALYLAQWYLTRTVPGRKVFRCRPFSDFETVREEFEAADIAFLLPHQAEMLPDKYFDIFINISSLHEMTHGQIRFWFSPIDRLCRGRFYSKQWIRSENQIDHIVVQRADYPIPRHWREVYNRPVPVQPRFFEALYDLEKQ